MTSIYIISISILLEIKLFRVEICSTFLFVLSRSVSTSIHILIESNYCFFQMRKKHSTVPAKYLAKNCFSGVYIYQILTFGFHFTQNSNRIKFKQEVTFLLPFYALLLHSLAGFINNIFIPFSNGTLHRF